MITQTWAKSFSRIRRSLRREQIELTIHGLRPTASTLLHESAK